MENMEQREGVRGRPMSVCGFVWKKVKEKENK